MIPFGPYEPDKGPFSATSIDTVVNALPLSNGWGPMPTLTAYSQSMAAFGEGDFQAGTYISNGATVAASAAFSVARSTTGTYFDSSGNMQTAAINGARIDHTPSTGAVRGLLVETSATNLFLRSNDFANAGAWGKANITVTAAALSQAGMSFSKIEATAAAATQLTQTVAAAGSVSGNVYSIYVKKGTSATAANSFMLRNLTTATNILRVTVNFDTGAITYITGSTGAAMQDIGNGVWRLTLAATTGISAGDTLICYVGWVGAAAPAGEFLYAANAQLESGLVVSSYFDTVAVAGTRGADTVTIEGVGAIDWTLTLDDASTVAFPSVSGDLVFNRGNISRDIVTDFLALRDGDLTCKGAWWFRSNSGTFTTIASTQTALFKLNTTTLRWTDISKSGGYTGPGSGELWTAAIFGSNFYVSNLNDPLQFVNIDSVAAFANVTGSPPQAKFIATIGDFLFLAHLKVGATTYPRKWQHCAINDPTDWTISGTSGDSDDQEIPDGGDITGIIAMPGSSARVFQQKARRMLIFSPGSNPVFQQVDIDAPSEGAATRGAIAPYAIVPLGSAGYFFLNETGFYLNDDYRPIGAERVDVTFLADVNPDKLAAVQAAADPFKKIIWVRYQDQSNAYQMVGYNWQLDRWTYSDIPAALLVSSATPGFVLDDLPLTLDSYPSDPLDSAFWQGGRVTFGAFKEDNKLYLFSGEKAAAIIETATTELSPDTGSYVSGAKIKGNITDYTVQVGTAMLPDDSFSWSSAEIRDLRTGMCGFHADAKYHRFRVNISAGGAGTHVHGVTPFFEESGFG